jgi:hypothetical protein
VRYVDPSGHTWYLGQAEANKLIQMLTRMKNDANFYSLITAGGSTAAAAAAEILGANFAGGNVIGMAAAFAAMAATLAGAGYTLDQLISYLTEHNGEAGLALATDETGRGLYILNRATGEGIYYQPGILFWSFMQKLPTSLRMGAPPVVIDEKTPDWQNQWHWTANE